MLCLGRSRGALQWPRLGQNDHGQSPAERWSGVLVGEVTTHWRAEQAC
jgi:hypothetical protein